MTSTANTQMSAAPGLRLEGEKSRLVLLVTVPGALRAVRFLPSLAPSLA